jgi:hypothetical protein
MSMHVWVRTSVVVAVAIGGAILTPGTSDAQIPDEFTNLRFLSDDISQDSLMKVMRGFSFALNVRCQYCHTGGDGISFEGVEFDNDDDPDKRKARFMLRMVENLNRTVLPLIPERDDPSVEIGCKTCHRGLPRPMLLTQDLRMVLDEHGADSTVARYRGLRERFIEYGRYDFGEWEVNVLAEQLEEEGHTRDAIAIYELNAEFYPSSTSIALSLGRLHEAVDEVEAAIRNYERVLELRPGHRTALERLDALRGAP